MQTTSQNQIVNETKIALLARGLMLLNIQKEMDESCYTVIDRITKNRQVVQRRQEYCSEIERVIDEAKLTIHLQSEVQSEIKIGEKLYQPEEIISYYNGVLLDQIHQVKDKLFRMIAFLLLVPETAQDNQKKDPKKIDYQPFLNKNQEELKKIGIYDLLLNWGSGNLAGALNKRTYHHHFVSTLRLNDDFQKIKASRLILNPLTFTHLSEYGKKKMVEMGDESYRKWRKEIIDKEQEIIDEIEQNIQQIAGKFIEYYKIPATPEESAPIVNAYTDFLTSLDIKNEANINKIPEELKNLIEEMVVTAKLMFKEKLVSIYLVGSCVRGEFIPGSSDINIYLVLDEKGIDSIVFNHHPLMNITILTREAFISETHKKDRFICWSDGVSIYGEKIKFNEKEFPKPGTLLCLLLNRGFIETLEELKKEVIALNKPDAKTMRLYSLKAIKIIMDFDFGVAMANKPFYTASRAEKIKYTKEAWPNEKRTITLERLYTNNESITQQDFSMLVDVFLENAEKNYQKLLDVESDIIKKDV